MTHIHLFRVFICRGVPINQILIKIDVDFSRFSESIQPMNRDSKTSVNETKNVTSMTHFVQEHIHKCIFMSLSLNFNKGTDFICGENASNCRNICSQCFLSDFFTFLCLFLTSWKGHNKSRYKINLVAESQFVNRFALAESAQPQQ